MTDNDTEIIPGGRIVGLDVLRGLALGGILIVNAAWFALPSPLAESPVGVLSAAPVEWAAWAFVSAFFELKFVAIFSLLFGAGVVLRASGREPSAEDVRAQRRRLAILAGIGLVHGMLLFVGDILLPYAGAGLLPYAGAGLLLLATRRCLPRTQIGPGLALILGAALTHAFWRAGTPPLPPGEYSTFESAASPTIGEALDTLSAGDPAQLAALETTAYRRGPLALALFARGVEYLSALFELYLPYFLLARAGLLPARRGTGARGCPRACGRAPLEVRAMGRPRRGRAAQPRGDGGSLYAALGNRPPRRTRGVTACGSTSACKWPPLRRMVACSWRDWVRRMRTVSGERVQSSPFSIPMAK